MTCKDCIHYEICQFHITEETKMTVNECENFKNKADLVEVVRCGECKHKGWVQEPCHGKTVDFCRIHETCIEKPDFCSYGERK